LVFALTAHAFALTLTFADISVTGSGRAVDARALDDLVRLELGATAPLDDVTVALAGDRADVVVTRAGKKRSGSVTLPPKNAERTLALFIGELARRFETETETEPPPLEQEPPKPAPETPPSAPIAADPPPPPRPEVKTPIFVLATMGARVHASEGSLLWTPRMEAGVVGNPVRIGAMVRYGQGSASDPLGDVTVHALHGGLAATLLLDTFATGPRVELGGLFASGDGSRSSSKSSVAPAFSWEIEAHVAATDWLDLFASIEAGWMWNGLDVRADDRTLLQIGGGFAGASVGLAVPTGIRYRRY
jgi:hypothetical protein